MFTFTNILTNIWSNFIFKLVNFLSKLIVNIVNLLILKYKTIISIILIMNLPLELVDKILQYDGRMKYRKGEFVNIIHPRDLGFYRFILNPLLKKKVNMNIDLEWLTNLSNGIVETDENISWRGKRFIDDKYVYTNKFYFEFEFDSTPGVGLCYDYYWGSSFFEICYYDLRKVNEWNNPLQIKTTIH